MARFSNFKKLNWVNKKSSTLESHRSVAVWVLPLLLLVLIPLVSSCDVTGQDDYQELVVIESYLVAGRALPELKISSTVAADAFFNPEESVLRGAVAEVSLLDENRNPLETIPYLFDSDQNRYLPQREHIVLERRLYRLDVRFTDRSEVIQAITRVPDQVRVVGDVPEAVVYQSEEQLEITISEPSQTDGQNVFVFSSIALEPFEENLTPFYKASFDNDNIELEDVIINSSGLLNEGNFDINPDGTITLRFPWLGVAFYGDTEVVTTAVDRNLADLVRSQEVQLGGSTLSPGEIPNLIYRIDGGIGVFGSITSDTVRTRFERPGGL